MSTTRQNILESIKSTLENVELIKYVELERSTPIDLDIVGLPCAFVYAGEEKRVTDERAVIGKETWEWTVAVEVWTNEDEEELLGQIHKAMFDNNDFDNYAEYSERVSLDGIYMIDKDSNIKSMILTYSILYRHVLGIM